MLLGVVSDIHGNNVALEAVLADMGEVDKLVCLGDIVGYGPAPKQCLKTVREQFDTVLKGNHDRDVQKTDPYTNELANAGLAYAREKLSEEEITWLDSLPETQTVEFDGKKILLAHSHPTDTDTYVRPGAFPRLRPYLDDELGVFIGHTHVQHKALIDGKLIMNPGSVGQPRDGPTTAAYALFDTETNDLELRRVEYDISAVYDAVEDAGLPQKIGTRLKEGW